MNTHRCLYRQMGTVLVLLVGLGPFIGDPQAEAADKPRPANVVLFVTDDQGLDAGCYGNRVLKTPHLDQLAAQGTRFTHAFCTTASCSAIRSVILSG
jgi:N-sulfoglucosamine sulfohydrolase